MAYLHIDGLTKRFAGNAALDGVSLHVDADELLVVLGPTGAGKTTLLRTIAGLESPDAGTIRMADTDLTTLPPAARDVALVFQNFSLYPSWTVRRNLAFPLRAPGRNLDDAEIEKRIAWAAEMLHITRLLDRPANRLSGGEMQRVAIGRAIVRRPRIFLMDEPLTNLGRELRTPMIFVTHDQAEALSMGDRIVVLHEGRVLQTGSPQAVYDTPASPIVARQLGQPAINLLDVESRDGHWCAGDLRVCLTAEPAGTRRRLGIRPEAIAPDGGDDPATIDVVEHMGPATILLVHWHGHRLHLLTPRADYRPAATIHPRIDPTRITVWDM
jgi:multiple sugar transport system ATP-binding protein